MAEITKPVFLIVEDEPDGQTIVTSILRNVNIDAVAVSSAEEALHQLEVHPYTGVVIDLGLPGMDGMELVETIRKIPEIADLPCIAITAWHTSKVKKDALSLGFDAYVAKPLDRAAFVEAIHSVIYP